MALIDTQTKVSKSPHAGDMIASPGSLQRLLASGDHLGLGRQFIGAALVLTALFGLLLAAAGLGLIADDVLSGRLPGLGDNAQIGLLGLGVLPILIGLGVAIIPRQLGSPAVAFPRAVSMAFWTWLLSGVLLLIQSLMEAFQEAGDAKTQMLGLVAVAGIFIGLTVAAAALATTVLAHRPLGMRLPRVPFFSWSFLVAAPIWIANFAALLAGIFFSYVGFVTDDNGVGEFLVDPAGSMTWFLQGPSVYIVMIPVLGLLVDAAAKSSGIRITAYGPLQGLIGAFGFFSFAAWTQSAASSENVVWALFHIAPGLIALAVLGGTLASLGKSPKGSPALLSTILAVLLLLGAVLSGTIAVISSIGEGNLFDTNFSSLYVAQLYFLIGAGLAGGLGGLSYWGQQIVGPKTTSSTLLIGSGLAFLGGAVAGVGFLVNGVAVSGDNAGLTTEVQGGLVIVAGLLWVVAALVGLLNLRPYSGEPAANDATGLTYEWLGNVPAVAGDFGGDLPAASSPYPLLDQRSGNKEEK